VIRDRKRRKHKEHWQFIHGQWQVKDFLKYIYIKNPLGRDSRIKEAGGTAQSEQKLA